MHRRGTPMEAIPEADSTETVAEDADSVIAPAKYIQEAEPRPSPEAPLSGGHAEIEAELFAAAEPYYDGENATTAETFQRISSRESTSEVQNSVREGECGAPTDSSPTAEKATAVFKSSRLQQLAVQLAIVFVSWGFLALLQPRAHSVLLLVAISLTRLHLGWLICCVFQLLLPSRKTLSACDEIIPQEEGRVSSVIRYLRERCWSHLPLRYWECAFYLGLLLMAFWATSVVHDEFSERLKHQQGGEESARAGILASASPTWRRDTLPPLLLNADSPQHIKIAATALTRSRQASDQLVWLLHAVASSHYGSLAARAGEIQVWLSEKILRPLVVFLRAGKPMRGNSDALKAADTPPDRESSQTEAPTTEGWGFIQWLQSAVQAAVRHLPTAAHNFFCGVRSSTGGSSGSLLDWTDRSHKTAAYLGEGGGVVETGAYFVALLLLLLYALYTVVLHLCISLSQSLQRLISTAGVVLGSNNIGEWQSVVSASCASAVTSFAVTFALLLFLYTAAAVAARLLAVFTWLGRGGARLVRRVRWRSEGVESCSRGSGSSRSSSGSRNKLLSRYCNGDAGRGVMVLEIVSAALTCWLLLLADRNFVMFTWATMQPLRLSVLSIVLLLRLPPVQVATLLSWPAPLREPALHLQRSQPLRIIDPVAVGSMVGCICAAVTLRLMGGIGACLAVVLKRRVVARGKLALPEHTPQAVRSTRGTRLPCSRSLASCSARSVWQQLQVEIKRVEELQQLLRAEKQKCCMSERLVVTLREELQLQRETEQKASCSPKPLLERQQEEQEDRYRQISQAAQDAVNKQQRLQDELARHQESCRRMEETLDQNQQLLRQRDACIADLERKLQSHTCEMEMQQRRLRQAEKEVEDYVQRQCQLEGELHARQLLLEQTETRWNETQREMSATLNKLQAEMGEVKAARDSIEQQLTAATHRCTELQGEVDLLRKKPAEEIAAKQAEIDALHERLGSLGERCKHEKGRQQLKPPVGLFKTEQQTQAAQEHAGEVVKPLSERPTVRKTSSLDGSEVGTARDDGNEPRTSISLSGFQSRALLDWSSSLNCMQLMKLVEDLLRLRNAQSIRIRELKEQVKELQERCKRPLLCSNCNKTLYGDPQFSLGSVEGCTAKLEEMLDNDEKQCREHQHQLDTTGHILRSRSPRILVASGDTEANRQQQSAGSTGLQAMASSSPSTSEDDQPLMDVSSTVGTLPSRGTHGAVIERRCGREILTTEEADSLAKTFEEINACIFPLLGILHKFELPRPVLEAAYKLTEAVDSCLPETAYLRHVKQRPNECEWQGDVKVLADRLRLLQSTWPSPDSCCRLLQREGEAHTLSPLDQKFLPFLRNPRYLPRLKRLLFALNLDPQWQEERKRLERLSEALQHIRLSKTLRLLFNSCAKVFEIYQETAAGDQHPKLEEAADQRLSASQRWAAGTKPSEASKQLRVWEDSGDFNLGCLRDASVVRPHSLQGFSLLHVVLFFVNSVQQQPGSETGQQVGIADVPASQSQQQHFRRSSVPELLEQELRLDCTSTKAVAGHRTQSPSASQGSSICVDACRCSCFVCLGLGSIRAGHLQEWKSEKSLFDQDLIFTKPPDDSIRRIPMNSVQGRADDNQADDASAVEGERLVSSIAKLYCDALIRKQRDVAELGRSIREELKKQNLPRSMDQTTRKGRLPSVSPVPKAVFAASSETKVDMEVSKSTKLPAPPAAEAASPPGHIPTETERELENACRLVETVHDSVCFILEAWREISTHANKNRVSALNYFIQIMSQREGGSLENSGRPFGAPQHFPYGDIEASLRYASTAKAASVAAAIAVQAGEIYKSTSEQAAGIQLLPTAGNSDTGVSKKPMIQLQQQQSAVQKSKNSNGSAIPVPRLTSGQGTQAQHATVGYQRHQTGRQAFSKPLSRTISSNGSSRGSSPSTGAKEPLNSLMEGKVRNAPAQRGSLVSSGTAPQQQGHVGHCFQPSGASCIWPSRQTSKSSTRDPPAKEASRRQGSVASIELNEALGRRDSRSSIIPNKRHESEISTKLDVCLAVAVGKISAEKAPKGTDSAAPSQDATTGGITSCAGLTCSEVKQTDEQQKQKAVEERLEQTSQRLLEPEESDAQKLSAAVRALEVQGIGAVGITTHAVAANSANGVASGVSRCDSSERRFDGNVQADTCDAVTHVFDS